MRKLLDSIIIITMNTQTFTCSIILCCIYDILANGNTCNIYGQDLKVNCRNKKLDFVPQKLPSKIVYLDLSNNDINQLRNYSFERYGNLTSLLIDGNSIDYLEAKTFVGLKRLKILSMKMNKLDLMTSYPKDIFQPLLSLTDLDIRSNVVHTNIKTFVGYPYFGSLRNLSHLFMDLSSNPNFAASGIRTLSKLKVLKFERCYLNSMPKTTFLDFPKTVREIYFRKCKLNYIRNVDKNVFDNFPRLDVLSIQEADINFSDVLRVLYPFRNKTIQVIQFVKTVAHNQQAVILTPEMMSYLQTICVKTLILAENEIVDFESGSLLSHKRPECFENIVLSGNRFSILKGHLGELVDLSTKMVKLKTFDFSYSTIKYSNVQYLCIPGLKTDCNKYIPPRNSISIGAYVDEENSTVERTMEYKEKSKRTISIRVPNSLETLRMTHFLSDPLRDDKYIIKNARALRNVDISYYQMTVFPNIDFDGPVNIKYLDISGIDSTIYCDRGDIPLFRQIDTVILQDARLDASFRKTNKIFTLIPSVKSLDISWNNLYFIDPYAFSENKNLSKLKLSFNLLPEIPIAITQLSFLRVLDVQYNRLHTINKTIRHWIDNQNDRLPTRFRLSLWGNVFRCTCDTVDFITWLFHTKVKLDKHYKNYKCTLKNGTETDTAHVYNNLNTYFSGCDSGMWLRIGIGCLIGFCVFTIPLALLLNYRWKVAFWIYRKFKTVIEHKIERKFTYDIYLSYSKNCCGWIKNVLIPKIEDSWKLKMCFEERDFLPGEIHADSIAFSIKESRHVIFVIHDELDENIWREYEIERTKFEKCTNDLQKIIVIAKPTSFSDIAYQLDRILNDVTMIEWSDDNEIIWDKLRMTIFSDSI